MANMPTISKRLVAAYILDWVVMIIIAGIGAGINYVEPYKRPFSLMDLSISYPKVEESIPIGLLTVIVLVIPAIIIFVIVLALVPGPRFTRGLSRKTMITRKLWEWEKGWAGLALALVCAFFVTQGMKNLFGRPRPSSIARCEPDLNNLQNYVVGGYGQNLDPRWVLVSGDICQNPDAHLVNDAFKSFPSGHASFSWAGLLYLSFFLCSKFAIQIPYLPSQSPTQEHTGNRSSAQELLPLHHNGEPVESRKPRDSDVTAADFTRSVPARNQAASPPNHLIIVAFIPVAVAVYICSTRFVEFYHFGTDLIAGSVIGILSAWFAFRWYHLPVGKGAGWAWGPRSKERAFGIGVGVGNYADADNWTSSANRQRQRAPGVAKYANGADYHQPGSATTANFSNGVEYPPPGHIDTSYSNGAHSYQRGNDANEYAHAEDWPSSSRLDQRGNERVPV